MSEEMIEGTEKIDGAEENIEIKDGEPANTNGDEVAATASVATEEVREINFEEALEAILFAAGHPISYATLARVFDLTPGKVKEKVIEYSLIYNNTDIPRGVILLTYQDSCQLCTKKYYLNEIRETLGIKKSGSLSSSSLEALAIVAYNQPVTRAFVDTLRRADSSYAMNNLLDRGLIESKGRLDAPGRPMLYGTTTDFLRAFGLKDISALPKTTEEIEAMFSKTSNGGEENEDDTDGEQTEMELDVQDAVNEGGVATTESELTSEGKEEPEEASAEDSLVNDDE